MPENRHLRFLLVLLYIILGVLGAYIIFKYILKWLLPFVIAFIIAALLKRPVTFLTKKLRLSRGIVSLFMVIFVYGVVGTGLGLFISFIIGQLRAFAADLPNYLSALPEVLNHLWADLIVLVQKLPEAVSGPILNFIESLVSGVSTPSMSVGSVFGTVKTVAFSIPAIITLRLL